MTPALRDQVRRRARDCCEYCQMPQSCTRLPHEADHIRAQISRSQHLVPAAHPRTPVGLSGESRPHRFLAGEVITTDDRFPIRHGAFRCLARLLFAAKAATACSRGRSGDSRQPTVPNPTVSSQPRKRRQHVDEFGERSRDALLSPLSRLVLCSRSDPVGWQLSPLRPRLPVEGEELLVATGND